MVEYAPDDLLRDVSVDQSRAQGVSPLMGDDFYRLVVLVADVTVLHPSF